MRQAAERPLSPHLQIYRWRLPMVTSISHRFSGILLSVGSVVLAAWVIAAAMGEGAFAAVNGHLAAWYGRVLLFAWSFALFYHLCNGIRHLIWDAGWCLERQTAYVAGWIAIGSAAALTVIAWLLVAV